MPKCKQTSSFNLCMLLFASDFYFSCSDTWLISWSWKTTKKKKSGFNYQPYEMKMSKSNEYKQCSEHCGQHLTMCSTYRRISNQFSFVYCFIFSNYSVWFLIVFKFLTLQLVFFFLLLHNVNWWTRDFLVHRKCNMCFSLSISHWSI